ncbi:MAG: cytochrome-c oxidase, cbb3-type subunit III [Pelagimonas sp.]|jgi:cytochrome c oxidase cbb3-type subunit 3|nr:cytochrome-c oxidase, cbb3-type subunit III [Pelagimonas sp.]
MSDKKQDDNLDYETTGHSWDGIQEYNKPLPRWWLWTFYLCIVWGIGYVIAYPAWPLINGATPGLLGYSTRGEVAADIARVEEENKAINEQLASVELNEIAANANLHSYALNAGGAVFRTWCAQCHGSGAAGASGYPNLLDNDWLWGGSLEDIHLTVTHGIRNTEDEDARYSEMPAFGRDELLEEGEIVQVVNYVMDLSGLEAPDASAVEAGAVIYEENCSSCHAEDGTGDRDQGAPNLADALWLFKGADNKIDYDDIYETVYNARFGVMPAWQTRLSEAEIRAVATYVHGLGGGEAAAE